ncbi:glycosyltransferase family 2 protein [Pseudoduganella ginsengisoli]|nr:glycosyltransferase family 2 protein [Pseudoduganella ginsengisoli]
MRAIASRGLSGRDGGGRLQRWAAWPVKARCNWRCCRSDDMEIEMDSVWVIIPAFNEEMVIADVVRKVRARFQHVIIIDDGSRDATAARAREAGAWVVRHPINLGQGAALQTGFNFALKKNAEYVATFDADGQHDIDDVVRMFAIAREHNVQVVLGSRFLGRAQGISAGRRLLLTMATVFTRLTTGLKLSDAHNGLRLIRRDAVQAIKLTHNRMAHASEILNQVARLKLSYRECGNTVTYTDYSRAKGQRASNAINILVDLFAERLSK